MPIYALGDLVPDIHPDAYIHPDAVIIGQATIGAYSTVWPTAVIRADDAPILIGERTSIQDGSVLHTVPSSPTTIGDDCTVGHLVHLEGCTLKDGALAGSGSVILHRAVVGEWALVAANAVVLNDMVIPPGALAVGIPAKVREGAVNTEEQRMGVESYAARGRTYREQLRRLD